MKDKKLTQKILEYIEQGLDYLGKYYSYDNYDDLAALFFTSQATKNSSERNYSSDLSDFFDFLDDLGDDD